MSDVVIVLLSMSADVIVLSRILALSTILFFSVILFQVPCISPAICTLPADDVVAYGILADDPIDTQALALHRYIISSDLL